MNKENQPLELLFYTLEYQNRKRTDDTSYLQQRPPELMRQSPVLNTGTTAPPVAHHRDVHTPLSTNTNSDQDHMLSRMEKQNEITAMLVHQQCLASLPKRDIQIFDGDPLQYYATTTTSQKLSPHDWLRLCKGKDFTATILWK